jgi:ferredoxin
MNNSIYFIKKNSLVVFLSTLTNDYCVVSPSSAMPFRAANPFGIKDYLWQNFSKEFEYSQYRAASSIRQFFTPASEKLTGYFTPQESSKKPFCIVGAKACDLHMLPVQDYVFLEGEIDPYYKKMRDANLIISSDCTAFKPVCFCLALEINPYPEKFFDINLSELGDGYLVEIGSAKGEDLISRYKTHFLNADDKKISERAINRKEVAKNLSLQLASQYLAKKAELYNLIKGGYQNSVWTEEALRCVECGACIMNCPTCHCFLLFDSQRHNEYLRSRIWDGCQYKNFTRVAGGANALRFREQRLRNRYIKKFEFFPQNLDLYACTGCGRCIESCPAKIDLREIFKRLAKDSAAKLTA